MSGIINKVKEVVTGQPAATTDTKAHDSSYGPGGASTQRSNIPTSGDAATHDTRPRQSDIGGPAEHNQKGGSLLAKMTDPRGEFDNDKQMGSGTRHTVGSGTGGTTAGPHKSDMANKMDPRVDSDRDGDAMRSGGAGFGSTTTARHHGSTTAGPHSSDMGNKMDPRVDSDRDNRGAYGSSTTHTAGPHSSDMANKLDPRVDSDRDGSNRHTGGGAMAGMGGMGTMGATHHGTTRTAGPHSSDMANKLDPRVDSDRDNRGAYGITHTAGPHSSDMANKMDPRVDSDRDGSSRHTGGGAMGGMGGMGGMGTMGATHHGATRTAGPHSSDMANKMDPRVDSDRDGRSAVNPMSTASKHDTTHHTYTGGPGGSGSTTAPHTNLLGKETTSKGLGPHNSGAANILDPRSGTGTGTTHQGGHQQVDSMVDGKTVYGNVAGHHTMSGMKGMGGTSANPAYGSSGIPDTTTSGTHHGSSTTAGPHSSDMGNKMDPRVDSDRDGRAANQSSTMGHKSTTGPHKSSLLNKLDPRVDSSK